MLPAWRRRRRRTSSRSARVRAALSIAIARTSSCTGLLMKSYAPARIAATADSRLPNPVMTTTGTSRPVRGDPLAERDAVNAGMFRSVTTTSKSSASSRSNAVVRARVPTRRRMPASRAQLERLAELSSSSTMSTSCHGSLGKMNAELGPVAKLALDPDPTAVLADDSVGDRQAQARPLADVLRSEERLEHARQVLRGDAAPLVADADAEVVGLRPPVIGRRLCARPVNRELHAPGLVIAWVAFMTRFVIACSIWPASASA